MPKNEIAANKIVEDIKSSAGYLTVFPQMAPIEPSLGSRNETFRALLVSNRYKIIYYVDELAGEIVIVTVWDCHRNPEKLNELTN
jgi:plasmid stabilization system protein ParE